MLRSETPEQKDNETKTFVTPGVIFVFFFSSILERHKCLNTESTTLVTRCIQLSEGSTLANRSVRTSSAWFGFCQDNYFDFIHYWNDDRSVFIELCDN